MAFTSHIRLFLVNKALLTWVQKGKQIYKQTHTHFSETISVNQACAHIRPSAGCGRNWFKKIGLLSRLKPTPRNLTYLV